jgi:hypothetical protein
MVREIKLNNKTLLEYTHNAFQTDRGKFRLSGSSHDWLDEFREVGTCNFYKWKRSDVYDWFKQGKIKPLNIKII